VHCALHWLQTSTLHNRLHVFLSSLQIVQGQQTRHRDKLQVYKTAILMVLDGPPKESPAFDNVVTLYPIPSFLHTGTPLLTGCHSECHHGKILSWLSLHRTLIWVLVFLQTSE
jgi:hypothetical protein